MTAYLTAGSEYRCMIYDFTVVKDLHNLIVEMTLKLGSGATLDRHEVHLYIMTQKRHAFGFFDRRVRPSFLRLAFAVRSLEGPQR